MSYEIWVTCNYEWMCNKYDNIGMEQIQNRYGKREKEEEKNIICKNDMPCWCKKFERAIFASWTTLGH